MNNKNINLDKAASTFRSLLRRRMSKGAKTVSALDLTNSLPEVRGSVRGALIRRVLLTLENEKVIRRTSQTVYNDETHHSVAVYQVV